MVLVVGGLCGWGVGGSPHRLLELSLKMTVVFWKMGEGGVVVEEGSGIPGGAMTSVPP